MNNWQRHRSIKKDRNMHWQKVSVTILAFHSLRMSFKFPRERTPQFSKEISGQIFVCPCDIHSVAVFLFCCHLYAICETCLFYESAHLEILSHQKGAFFNLPVEASEYNCLHDVFTVLRMNVFERPETLQKMWQMKINALVAIAMQVTG